MYIDTYLASSDAEALQDFLSNFVNYIPPRQGRAAVPGTDDTPEVPAAGNPELWYSCVRGTIPVDTVVPDWVTVVGAEEGSAVVGVWA